MSGKMLVVSCASLLLVQSISALSCLAPQPSPCANQAQPSLPVNYLPAQPSLPVNYLAQQSCLSAQPLVSQGLVPAQQLVPNQAAYVPQYSAANLGLALPVGLNEQQVLSVVSGSALSPSGLSVLAENLEISGLLGVQGALPFLGAVSVAGELPSGGQALVSYSAGPGVELTSGGCGQGLDLAAYGLGNGVGLANNVGLAGGLGLGNGVSSCGCRY